MECDRATMFPFFAPPSPSGGPNGTAQGGTTAESTTPKTSDRLRDHVVKQSEKLGEHAGIFFLGGGAERCVDFHSNEVTP